MDDTGLVIGHSKLVIASPAGCPKIVVETIGEFATLERMNTTVTKPLAKPSKAEQAQQEFVKLLASASRRGFHGTAGITLSLQDGHVQHLKIHMERMVK